MAGEKAIIKCHSDSCIDFFQLFEVVDNKKNEFAHVLLTEDGYFVHLAKK